MQRLTSKILVLIQRKAFIDYKNRVNEDIKIEKRLGVGLNLGKYLSLGAG